MESLYPATVSAEIAARRLAKIEEQMGSLFIKERPYQAVLEAVSQLASRSFEQQPADLKDHETVWTRGDAKASEEEFKHFEAFLKKEKLQGKKPCKYYVARKGDTLEVILPLSAIHKNAYQKTGMNAYRILLDLGSVKVEAVFRTTTAYISNTIEGINDNEDKKTYVDSEIAMRIHANNLVNFPQFQEWGRIQGSRTVNKQKIKFEKVMILDECLETDLERLLKKDLAYFRDEKHVLLIVQDILEALVLFRKKFVHCDLKMANIVLSKKESLWKAKVTDLGLSINVEMQGGTRGTTLEIAPEIFSSLFKKGWNHVYYPTIDAWGVGTMAYELLHKITKSAQFAEFKKAQDRAGVVWKILLKEKKEKSTASIFKDCKQSFQNLFTPTSWQREHDRFLKEHPGTYSPKLLQDYLFKRWDEEVNAFEKLVKKEHPKMSWLHGLLKVDPANRISLDQALEELKIYMKSPSQKSPEALISSDDYEDQDNDTPYLSESISRFNMESFVFVKAEPEESGCTLL